MIHLCEDLLLFRFVSPFRDAWNCLTTFVAVFKAWLSKVIGLSFQAVDLLSGCVCIVNNLGV